MNNSTQIINEQLDYTILLLTHIVCADRQLHSEELKCLDKLADQALIQKQTREEMERIFAQEDGHLPLNYLANKVPPAEQSEVMQKILEIAYADGFLAPLEEEIIAQIAKLWDFSASEMEHIFQKVEKLNPYLFNRDNNNQPNLSFGARLLKNGKKLILSENLISMATKLAPGSIGRTVERLEREILLAGPEYKEAIQQCAKIAGEDYRYAKKALNQTELTLKDLTNDLEQVIQKIQNKTSINSKATSAREVAEQLEISRQALAVKIVKDIEKVRESLRAKQRALNYFSIAFMGKSKAGKSTLHAIITQDGWEAIGVGKQRTTRLNRVYEWKNIRIIDTPGIGAPGGKTDEEVAESVIDESDVICYVVTNDSIQETEFKFLKLLKEKAKPLIILLNLKYNLRDSRRLEHFLKNPNKLFAKDGQSGIGGHIERIRRYANEHYANDYFDIVPVMLLAAQLSSEPEYETQKNKLLEASRIQDFLDSIRESLIQHGGIRRSQTFLGSTVGSIDVPTQWVTQQFQYYRRLADTFINKRQSIKQDVQRAEKDTCEYLQQQIHEIFQDAVNAVPSFAEEYWETDETKMKHGWQEKLYSLQFEERLKNACQESVEKYNLEVKEILEEVGRELQIIAQLSTDKFNFTRQDSDSWKNIVRIGGGLLSLAGSILMLFAPPVGIFMLITGGAMGFISGWFKSREQKRREAVQKISDSLFSQLEQQKQRIAQTAKENFSKYCFDVATNIDNYFDELIKGLEALSRQLETATKKLNDAIINLNQAYAKRIIDWCLERYEPLSERSINEVIFQVERDFGKEIKIKTKFQVKLTKSLDLIKKVLQENIFIKSN